MQLDPLVELNGTADFSDLAYQVEDGKYYAKGIRIAGLDNVRSDRNTDTVDESGNPVNSEGADTHAVRRSYGRWRLSQHLCADN